MYGDFPPAQNCRAEQVLVVEDDDLNPQDVIDGAYDVGAVTCNGEDEVFWVVFAEEPRRVWDFTERSLRHEIQKRARASAGVPKT